MSSLQFSKRKQGKEGQGPRFFNMVACNFYAETLFCVLFAPFCALLRTLLRIFLRSFVCVFLRSFACFCVRPHLERQHLRTAEFILALRWSEGLSRGFIQASFFSSSVSLVQSVFGKPPRTNSSQFMGQARALGP